MSIAVQSQTFETGTVFGDSDLPARVFVVFIDPDLYFNGNYSKSYFDFRRNFNATTEILVLRETQPPHAPVIFPQTDHSLSRTWRTVRNWFAPEVEQNQPDIIMPPPDVPQQTTLDSDPFTGSNDDCYIRSCYLTLNGKMMNSTDNDGTNTSNGCSMDYLMFLRATGCLGNVFLKIFHKNIRLLLENI